DLLEIEPRGLAAGLVHGHRLRHGLRDLAAHARLERPLTRVHEGDLFHRVSPFPLFVVSLCAAVHSTRAEPHVSPAPIPVISTSSPSRSRPSSRASASASGIEPDEVLP